MAETDSEPARRPATETRGELVAGAVAVGHAPRAPHRRLAGVLT